MKYMILSILAALMLLGCTHEFVVDDSGSPVDDDVSEEGYCTAMGGTWKEFPQCMC